MIKKQLSTYRILQCAAKYSSTCESKGFCVICFSPHYLSLTHKTTCTPSSTWCERFEALGWKCESVDILNFHLFVFLSLQTSWFQYQCKKVSLYFIIVYIVDCIYLHRRWYHGNRRCGSERMQRHCLSLFKWNILWDCRYSWWKMFESFTIIIKTKRKCRDDRAFATIALRLWNDLPIFIRMASSVAIFKSKLKTYLFDKAFYSGWKQSTFLFLSYVFCCMLWCITVLCFVFFCVIAVLCYSIVKHIGQLWL